MRLTFLLVRHLYGDVVRRDAWRELMLHTYDCYTLWADRGIVVKRHQRELEDGNAVADEKIVEE